MENKISALWKPLVVLAATFILLAGMKLMVSFFGPLLMALFFAAVLSPLQNWVYSKRPSRGLAVLATIGAYILILIFLAWVLSTAVTQIGEIMADLGAGIAVSAQAAVEEASAVPAVGEALGGLAKTLDPSKLVGLAAGLTQALVSFLSSQLVIFFIFVFLVIELPSIQRRLREIFGAGHAIPLRSEAAIDNTARYFMLRTLVNLVTGAAIFVICLLMNIPNAFLWGLIVFVLSYIPYIGMFIACVPPSLLAFSIGGWPYMLLFIVLITVANGLAEQVVSPIITGRGLQMSATLVFLSFMLWGEILGGSGYFLAVPLTVAMLLFFGAFEETKGLVEAVSSIPMPEPPVQQAPASE
jgi:predicted PurR-regulated permease PerM